MRLLSRGPAIVGMVGISVLGWVAVFGPVSWSDAEPPPPSVPDSVEAHWDLPYAETEHPRQRLDLLLPKERSADKPLPVIVGVHGGAWMGGHKRELIGFLSPFVASGKYAVASIGYRLSQDAIWPAQIHDCKAALRWLRGNAHQYGLDPNRMGVIGVSAGGHLVAMLGTSGDVKELEGDLGKYLDQSSRVTCVVDLAGPTDFLTIGDFPSQIKHNSDASPEAILLGSAIPDDKAKARQASPVNFVTPDDAPCLLLHGTEDPLVPYPQAVEFRDALRKVGVPVALITIQDGGHVGFGKAAMITVLKQTRDFFAAHLLGEKAEFQDMTIPNAAP